MYDSEFIKIIQIIIYIIADNRLCKNIHKDGVFNLIVQNDIFLNFSFYELKKKNYINILRLIKHRNH